MVCIGFRGARFQTATSHCGRAHAHPEISVASSYVDSRFGLPIETANAREYEVILDDVNIVEHSIRFRTKSEKPIWPARLDGSLRIGNIHLKAHESIDLVPVYLHDAPGLSEQPRAERAMIDRGPLGLKELPFETISIRLSGP